MYQNDNIQFNDFMTKYLKAISGQIFELEKRRYFLLFQLIFVMSITVLFLIWLYIKIDISSVGIFVFIFPFLYMFINYVIKQYSKFIKERIIYKVLEECLNIKSTSENPDILKSGLCHSIDSIYRIDDCFEMTYKNLECKIAELEIRATGKNINEDDNFKGVVIQFPNNKKLNGKVIIKSKRKNSLLIIILIGLLLIGIMMIFFLLSLGTNIHEIFTTIFPIVFFPTLIFGIILFTSIKKKNIQTTIGSEGFRKEFDIYADNISEAEMEVTPKLISKFLNFKSRFRNKSIFCSFYYDEILFAINGGNDLFEIGNLLVPINKSRTVYKFYNDINMLYEVMDYFFQ